MGGFIVTFSGKNMRGVYEPGYQEQTYDWRHEPGAPQNTKGVRPLGRVYPLFDALRRDYGTDAHCATYVLHQGGVPLRWMPRINKNGGDAVGWLSANGFTMQHYAIFADVDMPDHAPVNEAFITYHAERLSKLPCGWYVTRRGLRVVQPLVRPVDPDTYEGCVATFLTQLVDLGIAPDWNCKDWTRMFRLPNVKRDGVFFRSPRVAFDRMEPDDIKPTSTHERRPARPAGGNSRRKVTFAPELAAEWVERVPPVPANLMASYTGQRHAIILAIGGSLLQHGVPPEQIPSMVHAISLGAGIDAAHASDDRRGAERTVEQWRAGMPVAGDSALARLAPDICEILRSFYVSSSGLRLADTAEGFDLDKAPTDTAEEAFGAMVSKMADPPDGLTVIRAQCGLGKSEAARRTAIARARRPHASPGPHARAPLGSRTIVSVPTNELAKEYVDKLHASGETSVQRQYGVTSLLDEEGKPVCKYAEQAAALATAGISVPFELCAGRGSHPCQYRRTCAAARGFEGEPNARIIVAPHALLGRTLGDVGKTGTLVLDEPPDLLVSEAITEDDLEFAINSLGYFEQRYSQGVAPALYCALTWLRTGVPGSRDHNLSTALSLPVPATLSTVAERATGAVGPRETARYAFADTPIPGPLAAPPLTERMSVMAREKVDFARTIARAGRVLRWIRRAAVSAEPVSSRIDLRGGGENPTRLLVLTGATPEIVEAVTRGGPTLILDANAELHAPVLRRVVAHHAQGGVPHDVDRRSWFPVHDFSAKDGAPIARTLLHTGRASRKELLQDGAAVNSETLRWALEEVVEWAAENPELPELGIVTYKPLASALRAALGEDIPEVDPALVSALRPLLQAFAVVPRVRHYGAVRGLDSWKDLDGVVTIGDPIPNIGAVQHDTAFLSLGDDLYGNKRLEAIARAELEQAHGRLRAIHRKRPGRSLHVGRVLPGRWLPEAVEVRKPGERRGRPPNVPAMSASEFVSTVMALGGVGSAAEALGLNRRSLSRYLSGERAVPEGVVTVARAALVERLASIPSVIPAAPGLSLAV